MATVVRCDKCGNLGDGRYFGKMLVYPPNAIVEAVRNVVSSQGFNVPTNAARTAQLELDICGDCYAKFAAPAPFMITASDAKWPGEEIKEPSVAE